jgi:hypothetical protein
MEKGPGYGLLHIRDAEVGNMENARFSIKRGSDHNSLGHGGWQPAERFFQAQRILLDSDGFILAVGPEIVDHLDTRENYRLSIIRIDGSSAVAPLRVPEVSYSPVEGGRGLGVAPVTEPATLPPPPPAPAAPEQKDPEENTEADGSPDILPPPESAPVRRKGGGFAPLLLTVLLLALAGGAFAVWQFFLKKNDLPILAEDNLPPQTEARSPSQAEKQGNTPKEKTAQVPPKAALVHAREHLAGPADPAESVSLAKRLRETRDGIDAAFLLLEDAAQKGDGEAMLLTGGYFDPADAAPSGSIKKEPAAALAWYAKAKATGNPEADARIAALRAWAQAEAAKGSQEAAQLLRQF